MKRKISSLIILTILFLSTQIRPTNSYFSDTDQIDQNTITAGYWQPPTLVYPPNNTIADPDSAWALNPYMAWDFIGHGLGVQYVYESSHSNSLKPDGSFQSPAYVSGLLSSLSIPATGTPPGDYYWHVKALINGHWTPWSEIWLLTVTPATVTPTPTPTPTETPTPTPTGTPAPTYPDVVINEVYYDVDGSHGTENKNEWIELFNNTDSPIDLKDWYFLDDGGTNKPINSHVTIPAKGFAVFSHDSSTWSVWSLPPAAVSANLTGGQSWLNNNGDKLMLYNNSGVLQDWVAWENFVPSWGLNAPEGYSIARVTKGVDTDSPADWQVLSAPNPGTNPHPYVPPVPQNPNATPTATPTLAPAITAALSRPAYNTLRLNITNIPDSPGNTLEYQINYSNPGGIDKGVFGQVDHTQATSGAYLRSYFLGTCSSGDCISDADLSAPVYLTLTLNGTDIILRQPYNF